MVVRKHACDNFDGELRESFMLTAIPIAVAGSIVHLTPWSFDCAREEGKLDDEHSRHIYNAGQSSIVRRQVLLRFFDPIGKTKRSATTVNLNKQNFQVFQIIIEAGSLVHCPNHAR